MNEKVRHQQQRHSKDGDEIRRAFAALKYHILGHPRFLLRGLGGAQTEISLAAMAYNLKRMVNVIGGARLLCALATC